MEVSLSTALFLIFIYYLIYSLEPQNRFPHILKILEVIFFSISEDESH